MPSPLRPHRSRRVRPPLARTPLTRRASGRPLSVPSNFVWSCCLQIAPLAHSSTPMFWGHGHADPYLRASLAAQGVFALRRAPFSLGDIEYQVRPHQAFSCKTSPLAID